RPRQRGPDHGGLPRHVAVVVHRRGDPPGGGRCQRRALSQPGARGAGDAHARVGAGDRSSLTPGTNSTATVPMTFTAAATSRTVFSPTAATAGPVSAMPTGSN